jgi:membrane-associated protein
VGVAVEEAVLEDHLPRDARGPVGELVRVDAGRVEPGPVRDLDDAESPRVVTPLAAFVGLGPGVGYPVVFVLVCVEAGGVPVPGETALVTAAIAASSGRLHIAAVIALAAAGAIAGDNVGYLIGRHVGRRILEAPGPFRRRRRAVLEIGEPFFARHGPRAVFLGRWIAGLRAWAAWLAGANHMRWRSFARWNAAGGIAWATTVGLLAYALGQAARTAVAVVGIAGAAAVAIALAALLLRCRRRGSPPSGEARSP